MQKMRQTVFFMSKYFILLLIAGFSFLTNLAWENFHSRYYNSYNKVLSKSRFFICTLIDTLIVLFIYLLFAIIYQNFYWMERIDYRALLILVATGGIIAVIIEKIGLEVNLWTYNNKMPKIPVLEVGLLPVLQLMVLPVIVYLFSYWLFQRIL